jgi:5-(carboxyamino)imidazole ribonucleotide mutase
MWVRAGVTRKRFGMRSMDEKYAFPMNPIVGVIMGSSSDLETMRAAAEILKEFGIAYEMKVVSAHRTPDQMVEYAKTARTRGIKAIIAGAGGAAHLPGMVASLTTLPVIGVPIPTKSLGGLDSLYSIVQMPAGIPVATMAIGGAANAGLFAARILGAEDAAISDRLAKYAAQQIEKVDAMNENLRVGTSS